MVLIVIVAFITLKIYKGYIFFNTFEKFIAMIDNVLKVILIAVVLYVAYHITTANKPNTTTIINNYDSTVSSPITVRVSPPEITILPEAKDIPTIIDTNAILKHFFSKNVYVDTVRTDSIVLYFTDTITQNMLKSRSVSYKTLFPHQTIVTKSKHISIGGMLTYNKEGGVRPQALLQYHNGKNTIGLGFNPIQKEYSFTYLKSIFNPK